MKTRHKIVTLLQVIFLLICFGATGMTAINPEESLRLLDKEIAARQQYVDSKLHSIDSIGLKLAKVNDVSERLGALMSLGDAYNSFNNDSALYYYTEGVKLAEKSNDPVMLNLFRLKRAVCLPLAGFPAEAVEEYNKISPNVFGDSLIYDYYEQGRQMYSYISSTYDKYPEKRAYWKEKGDSLRRLYLNGVDPQTMQYRLNYGESLFDDGEYGKATFYLNEILNDMSPDSNMYARACHMLASIAKQKGNIDEAIHYLALSAAADIRGAVREVMSLQELGAIMYDQGEIEKAYNYLSAALSNAVECQASLRIVQTSEALPLIHKAHYDQINRWRLKIYIFIGVLGLISVLLVVSLLYVRHQVNKMKQLQEKLHGANQIKEIYISQFFKLCSIYIDRLNQFCKVANRKISSGQIDDLYKITKSGKIVEEQSHEFYQLFDDAFLHIYPTFVEDVNKLLREKIILKEGELLNNDLRILAFLRLGVEDTNMVAQILNYSVNTIYAYRNKLRNRAFDREHFEENVMKISSV